MPSHQYIHLAPGSLYKKMKPPVPPAPNIPHKCRPISPQINRQDIADRAPNVLIIPNDLRGRHFLRAAFDPESPQSFECQQCTDCNDRQREFNFRDQRSSTFFHNFNIIRQNLHLQLLRRTRYQQSNLKMNLRTLQSRRRMPHKLHDIADRDSPARSSESGGPFAVPTRARDSLVDPKGSRHR